MWIDPKGAELGDRPGYVLGIDFHYHSTLTVLSCLSSATTFLQCRCKRWDKRLNLDSVHQTNDVDRLAKSPHNGWRLI